MSEGMYHFDACLPFLGTKRWMSLEMMRRLIQESSWEKQHFWCFKGSKNSEDERLSCLQKWESSEELTWFVYLKYGESESWESTGTSPPNANLCRNKALFSGIINQHSPWIFGWISDISWVSGWYGTGRVPLRCGVWWTSRRHDRDEPWLQPCFYAVSPVSCMFFRELNVDMLSLENGGSFWQYCKLEAHEGPYCYTFWSVGSHCIHSDWTGRGGDLWCWSFPVKISSAVEGDTMPVMKIWGSSSTIDWKEKSPNDCP